MSFFYRADAAGIAAVTDITNYDRKLFGNFLTFSITLSEKSCRFLERPLLSFKNNIKFLKSVSLY